MSERLESYLNGAWQAGTGDTATLVNPATEQPLAEIKSVRGLADAVAWGREVGGRNLRALSFAERGERLGKLAKVIHGHRDELIAIAIANGGNTRGDAKFDIDGATAVLASYAALSPTLGRGPWLVDGEAAPLHKGAKIRAQHVLLPRAGIAVHINAFNFPAWGMIGKLAVAFAAGMPVISKPATSTALLAARIARIVLDSGVVPEGAFQLLLGSAGDLLDRLGPQDVVAFTGSADTGARIRGHQRVLATNARVNIEADSLNAVVIGPDVAGASELFDLVVRDAVVELTQKAGQKCTATRRILVPSALLPELREALVDRLRAIAEKTGDPSDDAVRMGPLSTKQQLADARSGLADLQRHAERVTGDPTRTEFAGVAPGVGYFLEPILLQAKEGAAQDPSAAFHQREVFGPVATLLPYDGTVATAAKIVALGEGSLVGTLYSDDREFTASAVASLSPWLGRLVLGTEKIAGAALSPGCVFPVCNHGGPGRAGDGAELGGTSGLEFYLQRTTLQGGAAELARLLGAPASDG
jgi:oxepin-CoA hydrolase/3-oxo-5,6-dehydrosuberyl-CoA semialdehyde dehydrogenase